MLRLQSDATLYIRKPKEVQKVGKEKARRKSSEQQQAADKANTEAAKTMKQKQEEVAKTEAAKKQAEEKKALKEQEKKAAEKEKAVQEEAAAKSKGLADKEKRKTEKEMAEEAESLPFDNDTADTQPVDQPDSSPQEDSVLACMDMDDPAGPHLQESDKDWLKAPPVIRPPTSDTVKPQDHESSADALIDNVNQEASMAPAATRSSARQNATALKTVEPRETAQQREIRLMLDPELDPELAYIIDIDGDSKPKKAKKAKKGDRKKSKKKGKGKPE